MLKLVDMEAAYNQAWNGTHEPAMMVIYCDHCQCAHHATAKSNDICAPLATEIREARRQAGLFNEALRDKE